MTVYAATKNAGKFAELRAIFDLYGWAVVSFEGYGDVDEGETSYAENAARKARALHRDLRAAGIAAAVVGDDSGLEVAALGGGPGVLSARYAGNATWSERRRLLLEVLCDSRQANRDARFVCALHFVGIDGTEVAVCGVVNGTIAEQERGERGFSYDAIFCETHSDQTFAELAEPEKNRRSHRARAVARLVEAVARSETKEKSAGT